MMYYWIVQKKEYSLKFGDYCEVYNKSDGKQKNSIDVPRTSRRAEGAGQPEWHMGIPVLLLPSVCTAY